MSGNRIHFSVITAASRPLAKLQKLVVQFQAQTFGNFEHIVVHDGPPPADVQKFFDIVTAQDARYRFSWLDVPDRRSGTAPRNAGIEVAQGRFIVFADDDDLYHPDYLRAFHSAGSEEQTLTVVRINNYGAIIPRHKIEEFPRWGHVGTPSCAFPAEWFRQDPALRWDYDERGDHDFRLVQRCVEQFRPHVKLIPRVLVIAANERIMCEHGIIGAAKAEYLKWNGDSWWERLFSPARDDRWIFRKLYGIFRGRA